MIDFEYAARNIAGVWRMALGREDWRNDVDRSLDGVFRSFWAVPLTAPFMLLAFLSARRAAAQSDILANDPLRDAPLPLLLTAETASFVIDWAVSIGVLVLTAQALHAEKRAADVIVGFNWAQLMTYAAIAVPIALLGFSADENIVALFSIPAVVFSIVIIWRVLRACLPLDVGMTVALIAVLTLISMIVDSTVAAAAVLALRLF